MAVSLGMHLEQSQKLIMTPQLRQALTVLQLPALLLRDYVEQELQANPALELAEGAEAADPQTDLGAAAAGGLPEEEAVLPGDTLADWLLDLARDPAEGLLPTSPRQRTGAMGTEPWDRTAPLTLQEHLRGQVAVSGWPAEDKKRVLYLVGNLNENGYLAMPLADVAHALAVTPAEAERLLALLQQLEPAGVGARDLRECLQIQLHSEAPDPLVWRLVQDHLEDLAAGRWAALARPLGVSLADLERARERIRSLEPKPGRAFAAGPDSGYVIPDASIERVDGEFVVLMNDQPTPRLVLSQAYRQALHQADESVRHYVEGRLQAGLWFLRALEQRRLTVYRVVEAVARWQQPYLEQGPEALRPLTLRAIGEELSLHESTISRAVAGKYVQTPRGLRPLSFFFVGGLTGPGGEGISSTSVKKRIERLLSGEDPHRPLADDAICRRLQAEGITLSRRTVAKYRQELGVPSSGKRRQLC
ncbi:MAG: RNA polymerase factor sigma-54 [Symbiobacteriia bacterium]